MRVAEKLDWKGLKCVYIFGHPLYKAIVLLRTVVTVELTAVYCRTQTRQQKVSVELSELQNTQQKFSRTGCHLCTSRHNVRMLQRAEIVVGIEQQKAYRISVRKPGHDFQRQRRWKRWRTQ
jgi:hypothetical protein